MVFYFPNHLENQSSHKQITTHNLSNWKRKTANLKNFISSMYRYHTLCDYKYF